MLAEVAEADDAHVDIAVILIVRKVDGMFQKHFVDRHLVYIHDIDFELLVFRLVVVLTDELAHGTIVAADVDLLIAF